MTVGVTGVPESRPVGQRSSVSGAPGAGGVSLSQAAVSSGAKPVYVALDAPCRVIDTRPGDSNIGPKSTPIGAGDAAAYTIQITGSNGDCTGPLTIPTDAVAVATNVTVIAPNGAPSGRSYFTVYPADATRPTTSNLNFVNGQAPTPNKVDVGLSDTGTITIYNNEGTAHAAVDVFGYYIDHTHDDRYYTKSQTYTRTQVDQALGAKADAADVYTKTQVDAAVDTKLDAPTRIALNAFDFRPSRPFGLGDAQPAFPPAEETPWRLYREGWYTESVSFIPECLFASTSPAPGVTVDGITLGYLKQSGPTNITISVSVAELAPPLDFFGTTRSIASVQRSISDTSDIVGLSVPVTPTVLADDEIVTVEICTSDEGLLIWSLLIDLG